MTVIQANSEAQAALPLPQRVHNEVRGPSTGSNHIEIISKPLISHCFCAVSRPGAHIWPTRLTLTPVDSAFNAAQRLVERDCHRGARIPARSIALRREV